MIHFISTILDSLHKGEDIVLVSIVAESGSTPRGVGAKMMVRPSGEGIGTIGGGKVEFEAKKLALQSIAKKETFTHTFNLSKNDVADIGMVCGGKVTVLIQYLSGKDISAKEVFTRAADNLAQNIPCALITVLNEPGQNIYLVTPEYQGDAPIGFERVDMSKARLLESLGRAYLVEPLSEGGRALLFGAGHVGAGLVFVLNRLGFYVVIMDDREEFINSERTPLAHERKKVDFANPMQTLNVNKNDYILILTRGHQYDYEVLRAALGTKARYIGMIGSKSKISATYQTLRAEGFSDEVMGAVHAPIGIPLGASTPEEIAISIAAEMIRERSGYTPD